MRRVSTDAPGRHGWSRVASALAALVLSSFVFAAPASADSTATCTDVNVPVTLDLLLPAKVHAKLCVPPGPRHTAIQVLLHGATYNSYYWDFPYQPQTYSYVRAANAAGYATLNVDRVGYGLSSRELSATLTATTQALVVHQVIQKLRAGAVNATKFAQVILVGHSMGSGIVELETSLYHDVDGVVLTGVTHHISATDLLTVLLADQHPAILDPKFGLAYDPGYLTTIPGRRAATFYATADTDPAVIAADEALKDVVSATELPDVITAGITAPVSLAITAPVLIADGSLDNFFCSGLLASDCTNAATLAQEEAPYFSPAAQLQTYVLSGAGHDLNLELNTASYQQAVMAWANRFVPDL
ncbi:alpha/beta fold hydrolase [Rugosimonospora acidiphila]|uniref:Alpha/beta fold hydrolase n=1 Tax=Rugosimonospora acidiphila TaxID=556531 RepID=A0ABP9S904_9ACTN